MLPPSPVGEFSFYKKPTVNAGRKKKFSEGIRTREITNRSCKTKIISNVY